MARRPVKSVYDGGSARQLRGRRASAPRPGTLAYCVPVRARPPLGRRCRGPIRRGALRDDGAAPESGVRSRPSTSKYSDGHETSPAFPAARQPRVTSSTRHSHEQNALQRQASASHNHPRLAFWQRRRRPCLACIGCHPAPRGLLEAPPARLSPLRPPRHDQHGQQQRHGQRGPWRRPRHRPRGSEQAAHGQMGGSLRSLRLGQGKVHPLRRDARLQVRPVSVARPAGAPSLCALTPVCLPCPGASGCSRTAPDRCIARARSARQGPGPLRNARPPGAADMPLTAHGPQPHRADRGAPQWPRPPPAGVGRADGRPARPGLAARCQPARDSRFEPAHAVGEPRPCPPAARRRCLGDSRLLQRVCRAGLHLPPAERLRPAPASLRRRPPRRLPPGAAARLSLCHRPAAM